MTTSRKFAIFGPDPRQGLAQTQVPGDGFCLSSFLIITEHNNPTNVLVGKLNPSYDWAHVGALDSDRAERFSKGWMLPSCHLMMYESPEEAAERIIEEQLEIGRDEIKLSSKDYPFVFSDVRELKSDTKRHWDIGFLFRAGMARGRIPEHPKAWRELRFVDFESTPKSEFIRSHDEVIKYVI
jgi:ADP-ribose pyrophosphatase YjhB (NUDIX family)